MSDDEALLAAVLARPDEDLPRLAYADWLEEHDQSERAEFIRVQIELARNHLTSGCEVCRERYPTTWKHWDKQAPCPGRAELLRRSRELWSYDDLGRAGFDFDFWTSVGMIPHQGDYTRGFVSLVRCSAVDWLTNAVAIRARHPVERVDVQGELRVSLADYRGRGESDCWLIVVASGPGSTTYSIAHELPAEDELALLVDAGQVAPADSRRAMLDLLWPGVEVVCHPDPGYRMAFDYRSVRPPMLEDIRALYESVRTLNATAFHGFAPGSLFLERIEADPDESDRWLLHLEFRPPPESVARIPGIYGSTDFDRLLDGVFVPVAPSRPRPPAGRIRPI